MKGQETAAQVGRPIRSPPGALIQAWKKATTEGAASAFGNGKEQKARKDAALVARLYMAHQCALLGVTRSSICYRPEMASEEDLYLMGEIGWQYLESPACGSSRMKVWLERRWVRVSRKRVLGTSAISASQSYGG